MNREQKAVAIAEIATHIDESDAIFAVDYRGITVAQAAELRTNLREADALFKVVKNSLTERAADETGAESLKAYLEGPTALTFVRGDAAVAAKAIADFARTTQLLPFKGGLMDGDVLDVDQLRSLSRLPSREVLYGQLVGVVASPVSGLVRTLNALISGLAVALGGVREKKESGEIPAGEAPAQTEAPAAEPAAEAEAPAAEAEAPAAEAEAPAEEPAAEADAAAAEEPPAEEATAEAPDAGEGEPPAADDADAESEAPAEALEEPAEAEAEAPAAEAADDQAEPAKDEPAQEDDNQADASAEVQPDDAEANPTKED
ncbi:MAG: large subunit ribosomal protein [Solirubrobacteraceae bacterium]|nr:large subunit ribosomal protein [Solirubrobacteraceae bacterium]